MKGRAGDTLGTNFPGFPEELILRSFALSDLPPALVLLDKKETFCRVAVLPLAMALARSCTSQKVSPRYSHSQISEQYRTVKAASPTLQLLPLGVPRVNFLMMTSRKVTMLPSLVDLGLYQGQLASESLRALHLAGPGGHGHATERHGHRGYTPPCQSHLRKGPRLPIHEAGFVPWPYHVLPQ